MLCLSRPLGRPLALHAPARIGRALALLVALALVLGACSRGSERGRGGRGLLVIAIDNLRADHTTLFGYDRPTTPQLALLARRALCFTQTFGAAPELVPAHAALLTGCDPLIARRPPHEEGGGASLARQWLIPPAAPSLARELLAAGFATAAFVDHPSLSAELGFDAGFEDFHPYRGEVLPGVLESGLEGVGARFLRWLRSLGRDRDWFAYLTVNELERSWAGKDPTFDTFFRPREGLDQVPPVSEVNDVYFALPRSAWHGGSTSLGEYEARYDGAIRRLDGLLHRLLGQLQALGRLEETTVCIVGSTGLGFGESGLLLGAGTLSDVDLHLPWVLRPPASFAFERGARVDALVSTIDIAPTLLEIVGVARPSGMHGLSQVPALRGEGPVRQLAFAHGGVQEGFAVRSPTHSYALTFPGLGVASSLVRSWYGETRPRTERGHEHLRDRRSGAGPGNLEPFADDPKERARLRAAGEEWYAWMVRARDVLHTLAVGHDGIAPELVRELGERGFVPLDLAGG